MFGISWPELMIIGLVLVLVVGPKDLPKMMRSVGKATARMRQTANEFRDQFDEAMREADLDEVAKTIHEVRNLNVRDKVTGFLDPDRSLTNQLDATVKDINHQLDDTAKLAKGETSDIVKTDVPEPENADANAISNVDPQASIEQSNLSTQGKGKVDKVETVKHKKAPTVKQTGQPKTAPKSRAKAASSPADTKTTTAKKPKRQVKTSAASSVKSATSTSAKLKKTASRTVKKTVPSKGVDSDQD